MRNAYVCITFEEQKYMFEKHKTLIDMFGDVYEWKHDFNKILILFVEKDGQWSWDDKYHYKSYNYIKVNHLMREEKLKRILE